MSPSSSTSLAAARGELRKKKQRHSAFTAMKAPRDLQSSSAHQMPTRGGQRIVRQWLDQAELLRKATFSRASQNNAQSSRGHIGINRSEPLRLGLDCAGQEPQQQATPVAVG